MIGAFFIDGSVSAPTSNPARVVYGIIIGSCIYGVRVWEVILTLSLLR